MSSSIDPYLNSYITLQSEENRLTRDFILLQEVFAILASLLHGFLPTVNAIICEMVDIFSSVARKRASELGVVR